MSLNTAWPDEHSGMQLNSKPTDTLGQHSPARKWRPPQKQSQSERREHPLIPWPASLLAQAITVDHRSSIRNSQSDIPSRDRCLSGGRIRSLARPTKLVTPDYLPQFILMESKNALAGILLRQSRRQWSYEGAKETNGLTRCTG